MNEKKDDDVNLELQKEAHDLFTQSIDQSVAYLRSLLREADQESPKK